MSDKVTTAKSVYAQNKIWELSKDFGGIMSDPDLIKLIGISRNSFYKYKKELKEQLEEKTTQSINREQ